jgi:CoA-transferase family III
MIPLAAQADDMLRRLAQSTSSAAIAELDAATLLGERAMLAKWLIPGRVSAGGGARLFDALDDTIALNLARPDDRTLLPALFETDVLDADNDAAIAEHTRGRDAESLVARGRSMGLAIAAEHETRPPLPSLGVELVRGPPVQRHPRKPTPRRSPRVLDLSALWAGPLAAHLLWLAGAEVVKVESRTRPDGMRHGDPTFYALLNQHKASVVLDFNDENDRQALLALICASDIVIEAARPRGLAQLGIAAEKIVATTPGLVWMTITAHGAQGDAAGWVGFGDDCSVAAGLSAALHSFTGRSGFVGDAVADPLTGIAAAQLAWDSWKFARAGRFGVAMSQVAANCIAQAKAKDPAGFAAELTRWGAAQGQPFPNVRRRQIGAVAAFGEHTHELLARL